MGEIEDRQELMTIARSMIALGHELREELKGFTSRGDKVINKLIETADRMLPAVMEEREQQRGVRKKKDVVYVGHDENIQPDPPLIAPVKGKRKCSYCRESGHRSTTCPKKYADDHKAPTTKKGKRK